MKKRPLVLSVCAATLALSGAAMAPSVYAAAVLEEIVVTARKVTESAQDIPVAVTAVSGEALEEAGIVQFEEISNLTPGFSTVPAPANETALNLTVRGQVQDDVTATLDPSVGVYLDGLYIARAYGLNSDLMDVSGVQMLKGPQGTLFGRNATGGAVLLDTNNPDYEEFSGSVSLTVGDIDTNYTGIINIPLTETLAVRIAHQNNDRDDYVDNVTTGNELGGWDKQSSRIKIAFAPTDTFEAILMYDKWEQESNRGMRNIVWVDDGPADRLRGEYGNTNQFDADDDKVANNIDSFTNAETETVSLTLNADVGFGDVKVVIGHREVLSNVGFDLEGSASAIHGSYGQVDMEQDSIELQLTTNLFDDRLQLVVGGMYFEESGIGLDYTSGNEDSWAASLPNVPHPTLGIPIVCFAPAVTNGVISCPDMQAAYPNGYFASATYWGDVTVESFGIYTQGVYAINDVSNLTVGIRYSSDDKTLSQRAGFTGALPSASVQEIGDGIISGQPLLVARECLNDSTAAELCQNDFSFDDDALSWTLGYDYHLGEDLLAYAKVSTGYRAGGFNIRTGGGIERPFESETTTEYEFGFKGDFADGRARWNTAVYKSITDDKQTNVIVQVSPTSSTTIVANAGEVEVNGLESELTVLLTDNVTLGISYAYTDFEYNSYVDINGNEVYPRPLPRYVPKTEFGLNLSYDTDLSFGNFRATAVYHWIDEKNSTTDSDWQSDSVANAAVNESRYYSRSLTEDFGTLNLSARLSMMDDSLEVIAWGKNVLDERARVHTLVLTVAGYDYASAAYNDPATYGLTVKYNF